MLFCFLAACAGLCMKTATEGSRKLLNINKFGVWKESGEWISHLNNIIRNVASASCHRANVVGLKGDLSVCELLFTIVWYYFPIKGKRVDSFHVSRAEWRLREQAVTFWRDKMRFGSFVVLRKAFVQFLTHDLIWFE